MFFYLIKKKINTLFAVSYIEKQDPTGEGEYFLSNISLVFESQFKKCIKGEKKDYEFNYSYSNHFMNFNTTLQPMGSWHPSEMIPLSLNILPFFKDLFNNNKYKLGENEEVSMSEIYKTIFLFAASRLDLNKIDIYSLEVPKLKNEKNWIPKKRGRKKGSKTKKTKRTKKTKTTKKKTPTNRNLRSIVD